MRYDAETMKIKLCKKCRGLGLIIGSEGETFKCPECSATGRILVRTLKEEIPFNAINDNIAYDEEVLKVKICKPCGGLGTIDGHTCRECGGTGRTVEQAIATEYQLHHLEEFE